MKWRELLGLPPPQEPEATEALREAMSESHKTRRDAARELRAWGRERKALVNGQPDTDPSWEDLMLDRNGSRRGR